MGVVGLVGVLLVSTKTDVWMHKHRQSRVRIKSKHQPPKRQSTHLKEPLATRPEISEGESLAAYVSHRMEAPTAVFGVFCWCLDRWNERSRSAT